MLLLKLLPLLLVVVLWVLLQLLLNPHQAQLGSASLLPLIALNSRGTHAQSKPHIPCHKPDPFFYSCSCRVSTWRRNCMALGGTQETQLNSIKLLPVRF